MDRSNLLAVFRFRQSKFVVVTVAAALQLLEVVMVAGNETAHDSHVTGGAFEFSLSGFEIRLRGFDVFLRAADFSGYGANLFLAFLFNLRQLRRQLLVRGNLTAQLSQVKKESQEQIGDSH